MIYSGSLVSRRNFHFQFKWCSYNSPSAGRLQCAVGSTARPRSFSTYCVSTVQTAAVVKVNSFSTFFSQFVFLQQTRWREASSLPWLRCCCTHCTHTRSGCARASQVSGLASKTLRAFSMHMHEETPLVSICPMALTSPERQYCYFKCYLETIPAAFTRGKSAGFWNAFSVI